MECNDLFDYGLKIYQNPKYFKFSLDSILLGEFTELRRHDKILDLCTGNAPIPMILTTKKKEISIDALEIQEEIFELAKKSVAENELDNQIKVLNADARIYTSNEKYDTVLANPPYFKVTKNSQTNENEIKRIARHEVLLTLEEVIISAKKNLKENGTFYMVHRVDRLLDAIKILETQKFGIRKIAIIHTKKGKDAEFFLMQASKYKKSDLKIKSYEVESLKTYKGIFKEDSR